MYQQYFFFIKKLTISFQLDGFYATVDQILEPFGKTFPQGKTFEGYNAISKLSILTILNSPKFRTGGSQGGR